MPAFSRSDFRALGSSPEGAPGEGFDGSVGNAQGRHRCGDASVGEGGYGCPFGFEIVSKEIS